MLDKTSGKFLTERYEKDEKYFQIYDHYRPDYHRNAITRKFYSKYEQPALDTADPEIVTRIVLVKDKGPKSKNEWPETTNQELSKIWEYVIYMHNETKMWIAFVYISQNLALRYGWFLTPLAEVNRTDTRFYHPKIGCDITKFKLFVKKNK